MYRREYDSHWDKIWASCPGKVNECVCVRTNEPTFSSSWVWLIYQTLIVTYHKSLKIWSFLKLGSHASVLGDVVEEGQHKAMRRFVTNPPWLLISTSILIGSIVKVYVWLNGSNLALEVEQQQSLPTLLLRMRWIYFSPDWIHLTSGRFSENSTTTILLDS